MAKARERNILVSIIFRIAVCAVLLGVAIGVFVFLSSTAPKPAAADLSAITPRVQVMQAQPVPIRRQWEGFGTAEAMDSANVPARVTAVVAERAADVRAGQPVSAGQLIVKLDESDFQRQVEIATQALGDLEAQLARLAVEEQSWTQRAELAAEEVKLAQADYERVRQAFERDAARQRELDQAQRSLNTARQSEVATREEMDKIAPRRAGLQAQMQSQEAALRLATFSAERTRIVSPIDGILQSVDVEVGESVTAGQRVARVVNPERIEVPLLLPAAARAHVEVGDEVRLFDSGATWSARVRRLSPEDDQATRSMRVYVEVARGESAGPASPPLPPGKFVQGMVLTQQSQPRWVVPRRAVDGQRVLLIEDGVVKSRDVVVDFQIQAELPNLGLPDRQWSVLKDPLPADALVVVDGSRTLAEGSEAVPVLPERSPAANGPERTSDEGRLTIDKTSPAREANRQSSIVNHPSNRSASP